MIRALLYVAVILGVCKAQLNRVCNEDIMESDSDCLCLKYSANKTRDNGDAWCPVGYFCPIYTDDQVINAAALGIFDSHFSNCTHSGDGTNTPKVECKCTPGFYCPENVALPSWCCAGFECASPSEVRKCPEGKFCQVGFTKGVDCKDLSDCPEGSEKSFDIGSIVFLIIAFIAVAIIGRCSSRRVKGIRDQQDQDVKATHEHKSSLDVSTSNPVQKMNTDLETGSKRSGEAPKVELLATTVSMDTKSADADAAAVSASDAKGYKIEFKDFGFVLKNGVRIMGSDQGFGVDGVFNVGELCAVMGPSGAGKSTILSLITGKALKTEGKLLVNGEECDDLSDLKRVFGFVPQEDIMIRELSVRDNIAFSARYRLPAALSREEINTKVNSLIDDLQIGHVQHTNIGDESTRGISGGQRKRVNIGIEMAADPQILFLDEPTSGLDSTTSFQLVEILRSFAKKRSMTIASVIHQPSIQTFAGFHRLLLLGKGGNVVYEGGIPDGMDYFKKCGFTPPAVVNPADFFLDIANGAIPRKGDADFEPADLFDMWQAHRQGKDATGDKIGRIVMASQTTGFIRILDNQEPMKAYSDVGGNCSRLCLSAKAWVQEECNDLGDWCQEISNNVIDLCSKKSTPVREVPGWGKQFYLMLRRAIKQAYLTKSLSQHLLENMLYFGIGLIIALNATDVLYLGPFPQALCYLQSDYFISQCGKAQVDTFTGTMTFMAFGIIMTSIAGASSTFGAETTNYFRECSAGLSTTPYFVAKVIVDIPRILIASMFFYAAMSLQLADLSDDGQLFWLIFFMFWAAFALGYFTTLCVGYKSASLTGVLVALLMAISLGGTNPTVADIKDYPIPIKWIWSASPIRWANEAYEVSQLKHFQTYKSEQYMNIDVTLNDWGFNVDNYDRNVINIFICGLVWNFVTMVLMVVWNADKKK